MQRIADLAGMALQAGKRGDLAVGGNATSGNPANLLVDLLIAHRLGTTFHPTGEQNQPGDDRNAADPGRNGMALRHRGFEIAHLEYLITRFVRGSAEDNEG